jgi:hypothetical protein
MILPTAPRLCRLLALRTRYGAIRQRRFWHESCIRGETRWLMAHRRSIDSLQCGETRTGRSDFEKEHGNGIRA